MEKTSSSPGEQHPASGIEASVRLYVRLGDISALTEQKLHRLKLLAQHKDSSEFNFELLREHCERDILAIDAGIRELLQREPTRGYVDVYTPERISGWAQYVRYPEIPVKLAIFFDQNLIGQTVANQYRRDLEEANLGSGRHGFDFLPQRDLFLSAEFIEVKTPNGIAICFALTHPDAPPICEVQSFTKAVSLPASTVPRLTHTASAFKGFPGEVDRVVQPLRMLMRAIIVAAVFFSARDFRDGKRQANGVPPAK
jgi:hypothetical protein